MGGKVATPDQRVADFAAGQHNVMSFQQLKACGMTPRMVDRRLERGWLHRIHRQVYAVGTARLTRDGRFMAATLAACDCALSHGSAGWLWDIRKGLLSPVHITVPTIGGLKKRPGLVVHRHTGPLETTTHLNIPVTTPARTILDLAENLTTRQTERAIDTAHYRELITLDALQEIIAAHPNRTGAKRLHKILDRHTPGTTRTRSEAEERFLAFCRQHGLPQPEMNHPLGSDTVDAYFPGHNLIVEIDPWHTHGTPFSFKEDRARDRRHLAAGTPTARLTEDDFTDTTARELRRALGLEP